MKQVILSKIDFQLDGETYCRIKFLALDGNGTILRSFTCPKYEALGMVNAYCVQYKFNIV